MGDDLFYTDDIELATWLTCEGEQIVDLKQSAERPGIALLGLKASASLSGRLMQWADRQNAISCDPRVYASKRAAMMRWIKKETRNG